MTKAEREKYILDTASRIYANALHNSAASEEILAKRAISQAQYLASAIEIFSRPVQNDLQRPNILRSDRVQAF